MKASILIINEIDNVAVALRDLLAGETVISEGVDALLPVLKPVPAGHKIALRDIGKGEAITKYGETVGISTMHIPRGTWVHTHNLESGEWKAARK